MRSLFKTLTITAFTVAGLAGLAQAAPHDGMHPGRQARAADEPYVDSVAPTMPVAFRAAPVMRPRLDAVLPARQEQIDAFGREQHRAFQIQRQNPGQDALAQIRQVVQRNEQVGGNVGDGRHDGRRTIDQAAF